MNRIWPSYWPIGGMPEKTEPFSWIVEGKVAASWWPDKNMFKRYQDEGILVIINCSEFDNQKDIPLGFKYYHINVPDYGIPTLGQIERFLYITKSHFQKKEPIVVHCVAGCGRTAQFIVAWACFNGYILNGMDPVKWIRKLRPCSLETKEQMDFARKICKKYRLNH
ncbi:MAG: protein-tyrosine phosphatase family protein [Candidatus Heimdallarchaeota archaeon]